MISEIIIDGKNAVMGRLASYSAKQAMLGKKIAILNCDEVIIIGHKKEILARYLRKVQMGGSSLKGPKIIRTPERILKRTIRGMLSHKQGRGQDAMDKIRCYNKVPKEYEESKKVSAGREKHGKFITLKQLCQELKNN